MADVPTITKDMSASMPNQTEAQLLLIVHHSSFLQHVSCVCFELSMQHDADSCLWCYFHPTPKLHLRKRLVLSCHSCVVLNTCLFSIVMRRLLPSSVKPMLPMGPVLFLWLTWFSDDVQGL